MVNNSVKSVIKSVVPQILPEEEIVKEGNIISKRFCGILKNKLQEKSLEADVFVGGSFAKGTLVRKNEYDIDIFVRFDWKYENLSDYLEPILKEISSEDKKDFKRIHGSRDYFQIKTENPKIFLEIIPVTKIKKPKEERNVTDLSYFHVSYVKNKASKLKKEIILAKVFCEANGFYGAESYINGFSGYALECLIIHYKSFEKMLKGLSNIEDRVVIDPGKHFKKKNDVFFELNENKLKSPVILIDPTYKERNAAASLNKETFVKFQKRAKDFLKKPSLNYFYESPFNEDKFRDYAKKKKSNFMHLEISTDKQPGDIAGTKLKKFSKFISSEMEKTFVIHDSYFEYDEKQKASLYLVLSPKKELVRIGPPLKMKKAVLAFKKEHKKTYEKNGYLHAKIKTEENPHKFLSVYIKENNKIIKEMGISELEINKA